MLSINRIQGIYPQDLVPKGQINLYGAAVVYAEAPKIDKPNCIEVSTPSRNIYLVGDTKRTSRYIHLSHLARVCMDPPSYAKRCSSVWLLQRSHILFLMFVHDSK